MPETPNAGAPRLYGAPRGPSTPTRAPVRRIYWVTEKLRERLGADTNEQLMVRAAEEGFLP